MYVLMNIIFVFIARESGKDSNQNKQQNSEEESAEVFPQ